MNNDLQLDKSQLDEINTLSVDADKKPEVIDNDIEVSVVKKFAISDIALSDIEDKIDNLPIKETVSDIKKILLEMKVLEGQKKDFNDRVKEALKAFEEHYSQFKGIKDKVSKKALKYALDTRREITKVDVKTGAVNTTFKTDLPKGIVYVKPKTKYEFALDKVPEKYFTKKLNEKEVINAIASGELPYDIITKKVEDEGSITLRSDNMEDEDGKDKD